MSKNQESAFAWQLSKLIDEDEDEDEDEGSAAT